MSANSKIEWCHHTHNIVWGCQRVSPGCQNCYAETLSKRYGFDVWGPAKTTERRTMSDSYWAQPLRWNAAAAKAGERHRVFCSSMADVFEDHPTNNRERPRLWDLIERTPSLDWLLLTKRPENIRKMIPVSWLHEVPQNVWYGTSTEDQQRADERIPLLLQVPAVVRFLSAEPLLGPITFRPKAADPADMIRLMASGDASRPAMLDGIHWVIGGGESGPGARPCHPDWVRSLRDQCELAGTAFFHKQWGEYLPHGQGESGLNETQSFYREVSIGGHRYYKVGKKAAGRELDGRTWDEFPQVSTEVH